MDLGLQGKVAAITGGSEGIGRATAFRLCEEGVRVAICARREDVLQTTAQEITSATGRRGARRAGRCHQSGRLRPVHAADDRALRTPRHPGQQRRPFIPPCVSAGR